MPFGACGQDAGTRVSVQVDSLNWYSFIALNAGTDVISGVKTIVRDDVDWLNFFASAEFYRFSFHVEYGRESRTVDNGVDIYSTAGSYYRFGPDVNFLFRDPDKSALFLGFRYAVNSFSDELDYVNPSPVWGDQRLFLENETLSADWLELTAGIKVKVFQSVWLGFTGRFKAGVDTFEDETLVPSYIPGFGQADTRSTWEFNYWIIVRLPFRDNRQGATLQVR